jgi:hypothetical protein
MDSIYEVLFLAITSINIKVANGETLEPEEVDAFYNISVKCLNGHPYDFSDWKDSIELSLELIFSLLLINNNTQRFISANVKLLESLFSLVTSASSNTSNLVATGKNSLTSISVKTASNTAKVISKQCSLLKLLNKIFSITLDILLPNVLNIAYSYVPQLMFLCFSSQSQVRCCLYDFLTTILKRKQELISQSFKDLPELSIKMIRTLSLALQASLLHQETLVFITGYRLYRTLISESQQHFRTNLCTQPWYVFMLDSPKIVQLTNGVSEYTFTFHLCHILAIISAINYPDDYDVFVGQPPFSSIVIFNQKVAKLKVELLTTFKKLLTVSTMNFCITFLGTILEVLDATKNGLFRKKEKIEIINYITKKVRISNQELAVSSHLGKKCIICPEAPYSLYTGIDSSSRNDLRGHCRAASQEDPIQLPRFCSCVSPSNVNNELHSLNNQLKSLHKKYIVKRKNR